MWQGLRTTDHDVSSSRPRFRLRVPVSGPAAWHGSRLVFAAVFGFLGSTELRRKAGVRPRAIKASIAWVTLIAFSATVRR